MDLLKGRGGTSYFKSLDQKAPIVMNSEVFDISGDESTFLGKSKFSEKKGNTTQLYSANCVTRNNRQKNKNVLSASNSKGLLTKIKNSKMNFLSNRGSAIRLPTAQST